VSTDIRFVSIEVNGNWIRYQIPYRRNLRDLVLQRFPTVVEYFGYDIRYHIVETYEGQYEEDLTPVDTS
jgi:hypothetical protein